MWGLVCSIACWAPPFPLMPKQASLFGSGVPLESPLEGHAIAMHCETSETLPQSCLAYSIYNYLMILISRELSLLCDF